MRIFLIVGMLFAIIGSGIGAEPQKQTLRFVQDDAQDFMVSKVYSLKYVQANDITPFVSGMVMRYNINSSANCIEYGANNAQMLTVTCPAAMMPYVDDFVAKVDRDIRIDGHTPGDIIRGTGITRAVYQPKYRSGQALLNVLVNSVIGEGPWSSVYAWDANSNQIYWKDNASNTEYVYQFLGFLDRPAPQITFQFTVTEVRESTFRDIGLDYLAWKNGPGLNLFQAGFDAFSLSSAGSAALQAASGPAGGFFFAPQIDASFLRILEQSGNAKIKDSATLTVSNSDSAEYSIAFNPQYQNIIKSDNDRTSVVPGMTAVPQGYAQIMLTVQQPIVNLHYGTTQQGYPASEAFSVANYQPGTYRKFPGTVFFGYSLQTADAVERDNSGAELLDTGVISGNILAALNKEIILARWDGEETVEQRIGVPFLVDIPVLGYLFGTTTTVKEKTQVYLTMTASMLDTGRSSEIPWTTGELKKIK